MLLLPACKPKAQSNFNGFLLAWNSISKEGMVPSIAEVKASSIYSRRSNKGVDSAISNCKCHVILQCQELQLDGAKQQWQTKIQQTDNT